MAELKTLYVTLKDALESINAIRRQLAAGGKVKLMSMDALKQKLGGSTVRKDIGNGLEWVIQKQTLETTVLSQERSAKFKGEGTPIAAKPYKGNGKKPGNNLTGS